MTDNVPALEAEIKKLRKEVEILTSTIRDEFARSALIGLLAHNLAGNRDKLAMTAYEIADSMIKIRKGKKSD